MKLPLIAVLLCSLGQAHGSAKNFAIAYNQITESIKERVDSCKKQHNEVVKKAYVELDAPKANNQFYEFVRNETEALKYINNFDFSKHSEMDEYRYIQLIRDNCSEENMKLYDKLEQSRPSCVPRLDELHYMKALIFAWKSHAWSSSTKDKARAKIISYLRVQTERSPSIIQQLVSIEILSDMLKQQMISSTLEKEIQELRAKADQRAEELKTFIKSNSKTEKTNACNNYVSFKKLEAQLSSETSREVMGIVRRV